MMSRGGRRRFGTALVIAATSVLLVLSTSPIAAVEAAAQASVGKQPAADATPCDAFRKNPDGTWTALRAVTVTIGSSHVSVAANTAYRRNAINVNGKDFATLLDAHCAAQKEPE